MATLKKQQAHPLNSMHTAGIFSDMTVDGPEIGTLVLIIDKAKNLPNRKTIGKQDPYCAARLGKEAKKTTTDVRGGQTPKWDQELRFTVHDCPDYYQLKVSVFNDDKKTDLIGETWIDLRDIVVLGGGQSDTWHTLTCRSRYAGEIRLEVTFYDSRPKPDKPAVKAKPALTNGGADADGAAPGQLVATPKRRPLPTEPPNSASAAAIAAQEHAQTPPRQQPDTPTSFMPKGSPLQTIEYNTPSPSGRRHQKSYHHSPAALPPAGYSTPPQQSPPKGPRTVGERLDKYAVRPEEPEYGATDDRSQYSSSYSQSHSLPSHSQSYDRQDARQDIRRSSFDGARGDPYDQRERGMAPPMDAPRHASLDEDRPPPPPVHRSRGSSNAAADMALRNGSYGAAQGGMPPTMRQDVLRSAHRQSVGASYPGRPTYRSYDSAPAPMNGQQYAEEAVVHQPSPPRHHSYEAGYDPHHRSMQPTVEDDPESPTATTTSFRKSSSRMQQPHYNELEYEQTSTPAPLNLAGRNSSSGQYGTSPPAAPQSHGRQYSNSYTQEMSVSPGAMVRSGNYVSNQEPSYSRDPYSSRDYRDRSPSPNPMTDHRQISPSVSPMGEHYAVSPSRDPFQTSPNPNSHASYNNSPSHRQIEYRSEMDQYTRRSPVRAIPDVPPSLVPGVDPSLALELSARINDERRHERRRNSEMTTPTRGRQMIDYQQESSSQQFASTPPQHRPYDRGNPPGYSSVGHSPAATGGVSHRRSMSPLPGPPQQQHTIRRKSISPAPPPTEPQRRLSGLPFAPDSFNELNPHMASAGLQEKHKDRADFNEKTGKIVGHDGREIDPSDHLPMETWAPEPEPREAKPSAQSGTSPSAGGGLPIGPSGRRQLRIAAARPQSMSPVTYGNGNNTSSTSAPTYSGGGDTSPSAGRNRLQKKTNHHRGSSAAVVVASTSPAGSSPLAPLPQPYHQDNHTPPRMMQRASTFDYNSNQNENHAPLVLYNGGGSRGGYSGGGGGGSGPPIPAKIPMAGGSYSSSGYRGGGGDPGGMPVMSGALPAPGGHSSYSGGGSGGGDWALMEEMRRIDIGTGRARRHHGGGY